MNASVRPTHPDGDGTQSGGRAPVPLPADDPVLRGARLELGDLVERWAEWAARRPMTAEEMRGADRRAQLLGTPGRFLMEHAGAAVAAGVRALLCETDREGGAPVLILAGPGNNGGDGSVAARYLAREGIRTVVALVATEVRPTTADAAWAWDALGGMTGVERIHCAQVRDVQMLGQGVERAALIVDALLGTGVRGELREPVRSAVDLARRARAAGVPVLAVDTPTAVDLTSGDVSDPVVRADVTVTFHRPKAGLLTRAGKALAGRVLVAPIGIPLSADPG
jgi:ADP-dependent NAD(P)H-hydrate dehydratase / NAD(P)H-hydrate epimerase